MAKHRPLWMEERGIELGWKDKLTPAERELVEEWGRLAHENAIEIALAKNRPARAEVVLAWIWVIYGTIALTALFMTDFIPQDVKRRAWEWTRDLAKGIAAPLG